MKFSIYRYNPETDAEPRMQEYVLADIAPGTMLRDALIAIKARDESLSFRHSCGEGVCGSDALNINGRNGLACITLLACRRVRLQLTFSGIPNEKTANI